MAQDAFVHLHAHSDFSMLDGHATVKEIVAEVARLGQPAVALADHGNQHGAFALQTEAEKAGIQPIFALEAYMAPSTTNRFSREPTFFGRVAGEARVEGSSDVSGSGAYTHATLIATTQEGLHNLFQFNTRTFTEGWYMKNRGDVELLAEYSKGLVSTTGCPSGEVQTRLRLGQYDQALAFAAQMRDLMGPENYFLELMDHDMSIDLERKVLPDLLRIAKALNLPLLATNDSHYARQQDHESHDHLLAMQTGAFMSDPAQDDGGKRFSFSGQGYFLKSRAQMEKLFPPSDFPGALDNTLLIAERAKDVRFKFDDTLRPSFPVPDGKTVEGYLRDEVYAGAKRRHGEVTPEIEQRIEHELNVIIPKNYSAYFLVVSDFIRWAKNHDIYVGPGRGSAGGCEVAFALDITDLDPIKHDLLFERFLNPERDSPPDIDVDIEDRHRDEVLAYVTNLYGKENVANIVTFTRMGVKTAIKDSAKILEAPYSSGELLNSKIPKADAGHEMTFDDIYNPDSTRYEEAAEFRDLVKTLEMDEVIAVARGVEGRTKTTGVHAAGVLISSKPLADHIPLMMRQKDGLIVTQFDYPTCEALGLIKVDFLGLRNLTVIHDTVRHIKKTRGIDLDTTALILGPMDDEKTFDLFRAGDTLGVFQLDGGAMRELLRKMKPTSIDDISAVLALYRPGPMGMDSHNEYAARKNGLAPVRDIHPELTQPLIEILGPTYGLCVYQEQVMAIAQKVAGYSLAQADNLRRAMGKKKKSVLDAEYIPFSKGMKEHGYSDEATKTLWDTLVPFAEYGFNKSHSMGYALISYLTAYLKANYPAEYMASLITSVFGKNELIPSYLNECRKMGFPVLPPDVNVAQSHTIPLDASTIMFGMSGVRHVSHDRATMIVEARERGKQFPTITDFFDRMPSEVLNSGVLHGLIHAGSFDSFGYSRRAMALVLPDLASDGRAMKRAEAAGQDSLFSLIDDPDSVPQVVIPDIAEYPKQDLLSLEREALGLYLSDHPLSDMADSLDAYADVSISEILDGSVMAVMGFATKETPRHRIAGVVTSIAKKRTKKGDEFAIVELEDLTGSIEMTIFSRTLNDCKDVLKRDRLLTVRGVPRIREEGSIPTFTVDSADEVEMTPDGRSPYNIRLMPSQTTLEAKLALGAALKRHPGKSPVKVHVKTPEGIKVNELADEFCVAPSRTLMNEIIALFGVESIGKW